MQYHVSRFKTVLQILVLLAIIWRILQKDSNASQDPNVMIDSDKKFDRERKEILRQRKSTRLTLIFGGLLTISVAIVVQLLGIGSGSTIDLQLQVALGLFLVAIPFTSVSVLIVQTENLYPDRKIRSKVVEWMYVIGTTTAILGLAATFAHYFPYRWIGGVAFIAVGVVSFMIWFSFEVKLQEHKGE